MRALVLYCHPRSGSFTEAVRDVVISKLEKAGADIRMTDLYGRDFNPTLTAKEHEDYLGYPENCAPVSSEIDDLTWCDTLIFVYPTWWFGMPAVLKGWMDRVLLPGVAFLMPDETHRTIQPGLQHITRLGVFTTCGASRWMTMYVGSPGKRTLLRGVGAICARGHRSAFAAHYLMDSSTQASRQRHLERVAQKMTRLLA